ncbi:MAG: hypothetical protein HY647_00475 [Acidobacteria bacterium]|nr:hypothetical protein [Acidobacteriota bacterium]
MQQEPHPECRVALVGASTLKGREVRAIWRERSVAWGQLLLLETEEEAGPEDSSDEQRPPLQPLDPKHFENVALAIFATAPDFTEQHWQMARQSGCPILDLSYCLDTRPEACLRALAVENLLASPEEAWPESQLLVAAHPAAMAISGIVGQLARHAPIVRSVVTVFEPVSERGQAAVEELHRQTVNLLSFQPLPHNVFDAQVAFNLLSSYGQECQPTLSQVEERIRSHTRRLLAGRAAPPALRLVQAPVFYGHSFSCYVELGERIPTETLEEILDHKPFVVSREVTSPPNVVQAAGSSEISLGRVELDPACESGYWLWGVMDNLRVAALNAVELAEQWLARRLEQTQR